jgi:hypothetical protein
VNISLTFPYSKMTNTATEMNRNNCVILSAGPRDTMFLESWLSFYLGDAKFGFKELRYQLTEVEMPQGNGIYLPKGGKLIRETKDIDEKILLEKAVAGDTESLSTLFALEHNYGMLCAMIWNLVHSREKMLEVISKTYLEVSKSITTFRFESKFSTWVCGIAKNVILRMKYPKPNREILYPSQIDLDKSNLVTQTMPFNEGLMGMLRYIKKRAGLTDAEDRIITYIMDGYEHHTIRQKLGIPYGSFRTLYSSVFCFSTY